MNININNEQTKYKELEYKENFWSGKRTITYENGIKEEWAPGDIGTYKDFKNATMDITEYIIIEKKDNINGIKIVPFERADLTNEGNELGELNINFN